MNTNTLSSTKYKNNTRTISGSGNDVHDDDVTLNCDTSSGAVGIDLPLLPIDHWSTIWRLYVTDISNNASINNITINAPAGYFINGSSIYVIKQNGQSLEIFISSNINFGIANAVNSPVTNQVDNTPFGPAWATQTTLAPSEKVVYDKIITIGAGFGNTAYVRTSGDDITAVIGNYLLPFKTIGAAVTALGSSTGSALFVDAGAYLLNDVNAPFGLKSLNSSYDVFLAVGCSISYAGSYGLWIINGSNSGSLYGNGVITNSSTSLTGSSDGVNNCFINVSQSVSGGVETIQASEILNNAPSGLSACIRVGNCGATTSYIIDVNQRCYSTGSATCSTLWMDTGSRTLLTGEGTYDSIGNSEAGVGTNADNYALRIINPNTFVANNATITSRGDAFGNVNTKCVNITSTTSGANNSKIQFNYCQITCVSSGTTPSYELVKFTTPALSMQNLLFHDSLLRSSDPSVGFPFTADGTSLFVPTNTSFKIIDTYAQQATGGAGTITNIITTGLGLIIEPNL